MSSGAAYAVELQLLFDPRRPDDASLVSEDEHRALLRLIRADDAAAFDALMLALARPLVAYAQRLTGSGAIAEDVVQDVFVAVWEKRAQLMVRGSVRSYLYTAVRNRAAEVRRSAMREMARWTNARDEGTAPGMTAMPLRADADLERAEIAARLSVALDSLPPRARETALLRWSDGMSRAEIGAIMGVSVATVNNQLTLAARVVRALLGDLRNGS